MELFRNTRIWIHMALWCFMILFIFDYHWFEMEWWEAMGYSMLEVFGYLLLFYLNSWILCYFEQNKNGLFISLTTSLLLIFIYAFVIKITGWEDSFYEGTSLRNLFSILMNAFLFTGLSYLFYWSQNYTKEKERNLLLSAKNKQMQLDVLKARMNPHFIFNTLNNMNALLLRKDDKAPIVASKLSRVLRYSVDDGTKDKLELTREIQHLNDYLELIKLQEPKSENIDFYQEGGMGGLGMIPFILISILENAIKHGDLLFNENAFLHINMMIDDEFIFEVENSFQNNPSERLGTGLDNIREQLNLAYDKSFSLKIDMNENTYKTQLIIELDKMALEYV